MNNIYEDNLESILDAIDAIETRGYIGEMDGLDFLKNASQTKFTSMPKKSYDYLMDIIESKKETLLPKIDNILSNLNQVINKLDRFKEKLVKDKERLDTMTNEFQQATNKLVTNVNNAYLNTGNTLSKIALRALPTDDKLMDELDNAVKNLNLTEEEKQNVKNEYMNVVRTERNKGGRKRKGNRTRRHKKWNRY